MRRTSSEHARASRCATRLAALGLAAVLAGGCATTGKRAVRQPEPREAAVAPAPTGAIYRAGHAMELFTDIKARRVGDILTVILTERMDASKTAATETSRNTDVELAGPTVFGRKVTRGGTEILSGGLDSKHAFSGEGETTQSTSLSGSIAVTVVEVLPHGRLRIRGEKRLRINGDEEHIRLEGVVRTVDIAPDNTVRSTQVAEARISYVGKGTVADASRMGWLARFFQSVIWPF